jgi:glycyl-tRNA synthetase (class II)
MGIGVKRLIVCVVVGTFFSACGAKQPRVAPKEPVTIQRNGHSAEGRHAYTEEVSFVAGTSDPKNVKFKKKGTVGDVLCKENRFFYQNGIVKRVDYYIYLNSTKTKVGKKLFFMEGLKPLKYEYYAIADLYDRSINLSGIDMYSYSENDGIESRRVIEYAYDTTTRTKVQISQYVIKYEHDKPVSVKAWLLDVATNNIIVQEEKSRKVIAEMIKNIEKSLLDRAQGVMYLTEDCK